MLRLMQFVSKVCHKCEQVWTKAYVDATSSTSVSTNCTTVRVGLAAIIEKTLVTTL